MIKNKHYQGINGWNDSVISLISSLWKYIVVGDNCFIVGVRFKLGRERVTSRLTFSVT